MDDEIFNALLGELILEECFEFHYLLRSGNFKLEDIFELATVPQAPSPTKEPEKLLPVPKFVKSTDVCCPICNSMVAGKRFAPHLERCLKGGKRAGRKTKFVEISLPYFTNHATKPKERKIDPVDSHPKSAIVRVRLRAGEMVPAANQVRLGASEEEFAEAKHSEEQSSSASNHSSNVS